MTDIKYYADLEDTSKEDIIKIHDNLRKTFTSGITLPVSYRRHQLLQLARMIKENLPIVLESLRNDVGKTSADSLASEIIPIIVSSIKAANCVEEWAKPKKIKGEGFQSNWQQTVYKAPKGVAVVISPWNYPYVLSLIPFIGVIASGCTGIIKPSEYAPAASSVLQGLFRKYLDPNSYRVITGDVSTSSAILDLKWDHILFTGSTRVGRVIAEKAARFLTPCTLELGGKSPVYVDEHCDDLKVVARRIFYGKQQNAGQLCVSPDYLLLPKSIHTPFLQALKECYDEFYPNGALHPTSHLTKMPSPAHYDRVRRLLSCTKGTIFLGGECEEKKRIKPTIITDIDLDDVLMEDELFAPILPVISVDSAEEAIAIINRLPIPLVIYAFLNDAHTKEKFISKTQSGQLVFNETIVQLTAHSLRFGGKGESGYGGYSGKHSFDEFTHSRGSIDVPSSPDPCMPHRYPPYTDEVYHSLLAVTKMPIPEA